MQRNLRPRLAAVVLCVVLLAACGGQPTAPPAQVPVPGGSESAPEPVEPEPPEPPAPEPQPWDDMTLPEGCDAAWSVSEEGGLILTHYDTGSRADAALPQGRPYQIAARCLAGNRTLQSIVIPADVTAVGAGAFANCTALRSVRFEGTLPQLPARCFTGCSALEELVLPQGLTCIGMQAFSG